MAQNILSMLYNRVEKKLPENYNDLVVKKKKRRLHLFSCILLKKHWLQMAALNVERWVYLNLQLADSGRQVENQLSHICQLTLQQLNGFSLTQVLWETTD